VKRHAALVPLSHDHHHALVAARRVRRGADADDPQRAATAFLTFFASTSVPHFREEEELLFPLVAERPEARGLLAETLLEHVRLHALAQRLRDETENGSDPRATMRALGELLDAHVRREERELFPLVERLVGDDGLEALALGGREAAPGGPVWGLESEDLNATLLVWPSGGGPPEHVNAERDVLVAVVEGTAVLEHGDERHELAPGDGAIVPKGAARRIEAGPDGVRYLSVHLRRPRLAIRPAPPGP
jgi:mannose-6-phosphate isomerase-like protein (cupin superfamily)